MKKKRPKEKMNMRKDFYRSILLISLGITLILIFHVLFM